MIGEQDVRFVVHGLHACLVRYHVRRNVPVVEPVALDELELKSGRMRLFYGNDAFETDRMHRLGDDAADLHVIVRRNCSDVAQFGFAIDGARRATELFHNEIRRTFDAALEEHGVRAVGDAAHAFAHHGLREHGCGRRAVTRNVVGFRRDLAQQLRAHVFEWVAQDDLARDRDAVVRNRRRARQLFEHHVAALGTERHLYRIRDLVDAALEQTPSILVVL